MIDINKTYCLDNLELMRQIPDGFIDLIYGDILYGTGRNFGDFKDLPAKRDVIEDFYLPRIQEMHRILKDTGSIYLQMDTRINHWIRCLMDDILGYGNFRNEIIWCYKTSLRQNKKYFGRNHDIILFYAKTERHLINPDRKDFLPSESTFFRYGKYADENGFVDSKYIKSGKNSILSNTGFYINNGLPIDWWNISHITGGMRNQVKSGKYYSQKPKALLERIIKASSNEGDLVADLFCGSGTTCVVAKELNRNFIGCDISQRAIDITNKRLSEVPVTLFCEN